MNAPFCVADAKRPAPLRNAAIQLKKYVEIAKISFKMQIVWRFDVAFTLSFAVARILFAYILWQAIFGERDEVAGFTLHSMLSYYIVVSFLAGLDMSGRISEEICQGVLGGAFSKYMVVPVGVQGYFCCKSFGASLFYLSFNLIAALVWTFIFRVRFVFAADPAVAAAAVAMALMGLVFMAELHFLIGILSFKFIRIDFFRMIAGNLVEFATGTMIPLILLPETTVALMKFFPFYYAAYLPSMLLTGRNGDEALQGLVVMSMWVLFFYRLNGTVYKRMRTLYEGVGI